MATTVLFIFIILLASILQASTGFGFSLMATPFLLLIFEPREAVQINLILSLAISLTLIPKLKNAIDYGLLKRIMLGSVAGLPVGLLIYLGLDIGKLKLTIGIIILLSTILLMLKFRIKQTKGRDYLVGGISGVLTVSMGLAGPPLLIYLTGTDTEKEKLRSTALAYYLFIYFMSLVSQIIFAGTAKITWSSSAYAIPLIIMGLLLGHFLFKRMSEKVFMVVIYIILLFTGSQMLYNSFG
ncbi:sulfite exporter TauE/SafE family protein [Bacillus sp. S/N-304-OC-R1]|uniref:sulfite exporter TauE/SafE family protein n=1 Tax=Bacillus sp. S/N-304-OC-R1 TaxID=2758034 RepID=UPI001C8E0FA6|nr:sulfite exporter TauE/SafE family protein [Bacillus sp. S/N-304-OC-R1]MBY0123376.1 sulfite exporter TauE/SafE family protein [Bacillus sp. S/N-304-OC-R1]